MNRFRVLLDMSNDFILFRDHSSQTPSIPTTYPSVKSTPSIETPKSTQSRPKILTRPQPTPEDYSFSIHSIAAAPFAVLAK